MASSNGSLGNDPMSNNLPSNNRLGNNPVHEPLGKTNHRCRVMGIVNVTPDSFSFGGLWDSTEAAGEAWFAALE